MPVAGPLDHVFPHSAHPVATRGHTLAAPRLYDAFVNLFFLGRRRTTFQALAAAAGVRPGQRVLDVGPRGNPHRHQAQQRTDEQRQQHREPDDPRIDPVLHPRWPDRLQRVERREKFEQPDRQRHAGQPGQHHDHHLLGELFPDQPTGPGPQRSPDGELALLERHKTVAQLSLLRVALWGAIAAAAFPLLTARVDQILWLSPIGALLAAGSVAMARRAELKSATQPPQLGRS